MTTNHPLKPEQGEDEDFVDYLGRVSDYWSANPPAAPEGFELVPCECKPRCWPRYVVADDDFYPAYCEGPAIRSLREHNAVLGHAQHSRFWRSKVGRALAWKVLEPLKLIEGFGVQWNAECDACVTFRWRTPWKSVRGG